MFPRDTDLGGSKGAFPSTIWTIIEEAHALPEAEVRERLGSIIRLYWKPIYVCIRAGWRKSPEDAKDLTQSFFTYLVDAGVLKKAERGRGRFRAFIRATLRNYLANRRREERQIKRGGDEKVVALDLEDPSLAAVVPEDRGRTPEQIFDDEWARALLASALEEFRAHQDAASLEIFRLFENPDDLPPGPIYDAIAARLGVTRDAVYHQLQKGREEIRELILRRIKEYALDDVEIQQELDLLRNAWS